MKRSKKREKDAEKFSKGSAVRHKHNQGTWDDYMRQYGYREYPCQKHNKPFCEECYGKEED